MKHKFWILLSLALFFSLACSITLPVNWTKGEIGELQSLHIEETVETSGTVDIEIDMGAGKLDIEGGANSQVEGEIQINVAEWAPAVTTTDRRIEIRQDVNTIPIELGEKIINKWDLRLGGQTPINLTIRAGAYDGNLDLTGIPLSSLDIQDGASNARMIFNLKNPVQMDSMSYKTGASNVEITGIANANVNNFYFTGGAGKAVLDFSGELERDMFVEIKGGVGSIQIVVPEGTHCILKSQGEIVNIFNRGGWSEDGDIYETAGSGALIEIEAHLNVGSLELMTE